MLITDYSYCAFVNRAHKHTGLFTLKRDSMPIVQKTHKLLNNLWVQKTQIRLSKKSISHQQTYDNLARTA